MKGGMEGYVCAELLERGRGSEKERTQETKIARERDCKREREIEREREGERESVNVCLCFAKNTAN